MRILPRAPFRRFAHCAPTDDQALIQETISSEVPITRPRSWSARPRLTAISASPFEFSYQKGVLGGRSLKVLARSSTRPAAALNRST